MRPLLFLLFLLPLVRALALASLDCNQVCGSISVPFPFGFSSACHISLSCTATGAIRLGQFHVRNITSDSLLLTVPPSCDRPIDALQELFGPNFALTRRNAPLLRNCTTLNSAPECSISTQLISYRLNRSTCEPEEGNMTSCYTNATTATNRGGDFFTAGELRATSCRSLFSSVIYELDDGNLTALMFTEAEVGWWLEGDTCQCAPEANCTAFTSPFNGRPVFTCKCGDGFEGDGFSPSTSGARGCSQVSACRSGDYTPSKCGGSSRTGLLVGGIIAGGSIMSGLVILIFLVRRRCSASSSKAKRLLSEASFNVPFYPYKTIERATDNFADTHRLGNGAYGTVFIGNLTNGDLVAVKKIKHPEPETIEQVMNEVKMISSLNHPNLIRLLGCCIERGEQILVYEFMPNGTLSQHLQRERGPGLSWTARLSIAAETANAISYLHSAVLHTPIYHRDIKSSNILLDHQFNAKIADFGLSRAIVTESSHVSTAPQGTPGYVDPQYHQNYHLSDKSDVYSFGVVLMEIITGLKVVDFNRVQTEVNLAAMVVDRISKGRVDELIDPFLKTDTESDGWATASIHKAVELAFRCLAFHRDMRPSMMEVADELEQIRASCWIPKDGDVVVLSLNVELCSSPLMEGSGRVESVGKSKRVVFGSTRIAEGMGINSPVSVQDKWVSDQSSPSSNSLLGYSNH